MERQIIYSKQYPRVEAEKLLQEAESGLNFQGKPRTWEEWQRKLEEACECRPRPGAEEASEALIALAKRFSACYEIDTEIVRGRFFLDATLFFPCSSLEGAIKDDFQQLCLLADELSFSPSRDGTDGFAALIQYKLVDTYLRGRKID